MSTRTYNWNGTALNSMDVNVANIVKSLFRYLASEDWATGVWPGSGYRPNSMEHKSGRAIDIIVVPKVGMRPDGDEYNAAIRLVNLLIKHGKTLRIQWILFSRDGRVTHSYNIDRMSWKKLENRGSVSANHIDHIHVYFKPGARLTDNFKWEDKTTPIATPKLRISVTALRKASETDPPKTGTPTGPSGPMVAYLEEALVKRGYLDKKHLDSHYGKATVDAVKRYQRKHSPSVTVRTKPDGWLGPKELKHLFSHVGMTDNVIVP